jgi:hypothetical protein
MSSQLHAPAALLPVPTEQKAGWAPEPVWATRRNENSCPQRDSNYVIILFNYKYTYGGGGITPRSLDVSTIWRPVVRLIVWQLYPSSVPHWTEGCGAPEPVWMLWRREEYIGPYGNRMPVPRPSIPQPKICTRFWSTWWKVKFQARAAETNSLNVLGSTPETCRHWNWTVEARSHTSLTKTR